MKLLRLAALILRANFFFPVSCTSFLFVGTIAGSKLDERDVSKGDTVHRHFSVAVEPGEAGRRFRVLNLNELEEREKRPATFLLSKPEGHATTKYSKMSYKVLENTGRFLEGKYLASIQHILRGGPVMDVLAMTISAGHPAAAPPSCGPDGCCRNQAAPAGPCS